MHPVAFDESHISGGLSSSGFHLENGSYQRDQGQVNVNVLVKQLLISIATGSLFTGT